MSLKLTTSLSQRLVLTPQLRQRIEMLQMTSLELSDLIQQQLLENPVLEEVPSQEEVQELAEKVLDHLSSSSEASFGEAGGEAPEPGAAATNGSGDPDVVASVAPLNRKLISARPPRVQKVVKRATAQSMKRATLLKRSISDVSFRTISIPVTRHRRSNTKKTHLPSNSF